MLKRVTNDVDIYECYNRSKYQLLVYPAYLQNPQVELPMANESFMDKIRTFLGLRQEPPRNDFRNPIWGSDDEDDGDELYNKQHSNITIIPDAAEMHQEFAKHMHEMFRSFGNMFGDMRLFFNEDHLDSLPEIPDHSESDNYNSKSIRDYYLKPGYHNGRHEHPQEDMDLDGKISSNEISGLLKRKEDDRGVHAPFNGSMVPGRSFCQTIITTSVTKPDGTVETRRIIKNGNEVIEETTTTSSGTETIGPGIDAMSNTSMIYNTVLSELSSLFRNFY